MNFLSGIKKLFARAGKSPLVKTTFLNGIASFIKIFTALISGKISAVFLGPAGMALVGQFMNVTAMAMSFSTMGINSGISKYTAEYYDDILKRRHVLSTGFKITFIASLVVSICVFFMRHYLSKRYLHTDQYAGIFTVLSATLVLFAFNSFFISVLNGYHEFKKITAVNIFGAIVGLAVMVLLVVNYGLFGAFLGIILSQTLTFFVTLHF